MRKNMRTNMILSVAAALRKPVVAIPKASTVAHMRENVNAVDFALTKEEIERIDKASSGFSYPNWGKTILSHL